MAGESLLVVEDEQDILNLLAYNLENAGYKVHKAGTGSQGVVKAREHVPDLILLDLMLPDFDGMEVCRRLRQDPKTQTIPIIMLTAKSGDEDIVHGLEAGANDYVTKPFSPKVLEARIRNVLRSRSEPSGETPSVISHRGLEIDKARHEVKFQGEGVVLSATEFAILYHLASHPGWVFSRNQIIDAVKGQNYPVTERSVDVQILGIRKKLGDTGQYIETIRGVGYRFKGE
jgi:two-component system phosphate regulon response regulator PhoB